jgi:hypothetical protein
VIRAYTGDGQFINDPPETFDSRAVVEGTPAGAIETNLHERLSTPCGHERLAYSEDSKRGVHDLFWLGYVHAQLACTKISQAKARYRAAREAALEENRI